MTKAFFLILVALAVGSFTMLMQLLLWFPEKRDEVGFEAAKSCIQLIAVVLVGSLVTHMTARWQRRQDQKQHEREAERARQEKERDAERVQLESRTAVRREFLLRIHHAYTEVKRIKRLLRATACVPAYHGARSDDVLVLVKQYDSLLQGLNDTQLELEVLTKELRAGGGAFERSEDIAKAVKRMETTIKAMITEYERERGNFPADKPGRRIGELPALRKFVDGRMNTEISHGYTDPYKKAVELIHQELNAPPPEFGTPDYLNPGVASSEERAGQIAPSTGGPAPPSASA